MDEKIELKYLKKLTNKKFNTVGKLDIFKKYYNFKFEKSETFF